MNHYLEFSQAVYELAHEMFDEMTWDKVSIDEYNDFEGEEARDLLFDSVNLAIRRSFRCFMMEMENASELFVHVFPSLLEERDV